MRLYRSLLVVLLAALPAHGATAGLSWTPSPNDGLGLTYNVYRAVGTLDGGGAVACPAAPGTAWVKIASGIPAGTFTYDDTTPVIGTGYCYYETSTLVIESVPSNIVSIVFMPGPSTLAIQSK